MPSAHSFRIALHRACLLSAIASLALLAVFTARAASADQSAIATVGLTAAQSAADAAARCDAPAFETAAAQYATSRPFTPADERAPADALMSRAAATFAGCQSVGSTGAPVVSNSTTTTTTQVTRTTQRAGQSNTYSASTSTSTQSPAPPATPAIPPTPRPSVWLDLAFAVPGTIVSLSGSSFTPGSVVSICWNSDADPCQDVAGAGPTGISVDGDGGFTIEFAVPADAPGDHVVTLTVADTFGLQATTSLHVPMP